MAWFGSTKYNSKGGLIASTYNWRAGNLDDPDAQKYRGRGFKQLTGRTNYVNYWVYRGWLDKSTFDSFLALPYQSVDKEILNKYDVKNWINYLFKIEPYQEINRIK